MRLTLTVVDPYGGDSADVVLDADPESTVGDVARELAAQVGLTGAQVIPIGHQGRTPGGNTPMVYVDGYAVDPSATVVGSPCATAPSSPSRTPPAVCPASPPASSNCASSADPPPASYTGSASGATTSAAATPPTSASTTPRSRPAR